MHPTQKEQMRTSPCTSEVVYQETLPFRSTGAMNRGKHATNPRKGRELNLNSQAPTGGENDEGAGTVYMRAFFVDRKRLTHHSYSRALTNAHPGIVVVGKYIELL